MPFSALDTEGIAQWYVNSPAQPTKAPAPIEVMLAGITSEVMLLQFAKAPLDIALTLYVNSPTVMVSGIVMSPVVPDMPNTLAVDAPVTT